MNGNGRHQDLRQSRPIPDLPFPVPAWEAEQSRLATTMILEQANKPVEEPSKESATLPNESFHFTDWGNAKRLVDRFGEDLRYCHASAKWFIWDGRRWMVDATDEVVRRAKQTVAGIYAEASRAPEAPQRKTIADHAKRSEADSKIKAMLSSAQSEPGIPVTPDQLNSDPMLFNVLNGTIDLRTGELRSHQREDLITKLAPVEYDPEARLDVWDAHLEQATGGDQELQRFLQKAEGYSLTGDTGEEKLLFFHGPAATAKSTHLEALKATWGDYATTADFETFLARRSSGGARNDVARLAGARLVVSIEVQDGAALADGLVKMLTGGDKVSARFLYQEYFEFLPQFKLLLAANHAPSVSDDDDAMWRRILLVPFDQIIPKEQRDPRVKATLRDPAIAGPAILAWAVQGCLAWQQEGLGVPPRVESATEKYRVSMDPLGEFIAECCILAPTAWAAAKDLQEVYHRWCKEQGDISPLKGRAWGERLKAKGCTRRDTAQARGWQGIGLLSSYQESMTDSADNDTFEASAVNLSSNLPHVGVSAPTCHSVISDDNVSFLPSCPPPDRPCYICGNEDWEPTEDGWKCSCQR